MSKLTKALTAAAGNAGGDNLYVEDVFSTYLYEGNSSTRTITNGIDLNGEGGLVWIKARTSGVTANHSLFDTERGIYKWLRSNLTSAELSYSNTVTAFNADGFDLGVNNQQNYSGEDYASWTFRKAEKFFDVQTYTGNGSAGRTIAHNLGSTPGMLIVKCTNASSTYWIVWHSSLTGNNYLVLNEAWGQSSNGEQNLGNNVSLIPPTSTVFTVGDTTNTNANGSTYVAYLFASDAGGFGDDGSESIIKCGSYTEPNNGAFTDVDLGFEPQFIIAKCSSSSGSNWVMSDSMRGMPVGDGAAILNPNTSAAETAGFANAYFRPTATGFSAGNTFVGGGGQTIIYIAIRRPMKTPESGTEVFGAIGGPQTNGFPTGVFSDASIVGARSGSDKYYGFSSRLTGTGYLNTTSTGAENSSSGFTWDRMTGFWEGSWPSDYFGWSFKRATGFMDVVAYSGTNSGTLTNTHNLGVTPELMIGKGRGISTNWYVFHKDYEPNGWLQSTNAFTNSWRIGEPTSSSFVVRGINNTATALNGSSTYIAYLFATLAGVSKVGSYTGTGSNVDVDCGFSAGARFILIKRTDSTGDWYVYDSERGIVAGNDPYLLLNSTAAEVTNTDYIDPLSSGFTVTSSAPAALNASGGTYIFLAIAQVT